MELPRPFVFQSCRCCPSGRFPFGPTDDGTSAQTGPSAEALRAISPLRTDVGSARTSVEGEERLTVAMPDKTVATVEALWSGLFQVSMVAFARFLDCTTHAFIFTDSCHRTVLSDRCSPPRWLRNDLAVALRRCGRQSFREWVMFGFGQEMQPGITSCYAAMRVCMFALYFEAPCRGWWGLGFEEHPTPTLTQKARLRRAAKSRAQGFLEVRLG